MRNGCVKLQKHWGRRIGSDGFRILSSGIVIPQIFQGNLNLE